MLLRKKIPITIISLVSIPLILLSIIVYTYTSSALIQINKDRIRNISEIEGEKLNNIIASRAQQIETIVKIREIINLVTTEYNETIGYLDLKQRNEAYDILEKITQDADELDNIFIANLRGEIILGTKTDEPYSNINNTYYFEEARNGKTVISNMMQSHGYAEKVIVITTPIKDDKQQIVGVLGNTFKLDYFKNKITNVNMDNKGYAYIVDAEGVIVAHPDPERLGTEVVNEAINQIIEKIKNNEPVYRGEGSYIYQGKQKYMAYSVIPQINWIIVFAQNQNEMNEPARIVLVLILITTLGFIILSLVTSLEFSKSITQPIDQLIHTMDKATHGDLTSKCHFKSNNEFGRLAYNFNSMLSQLSASYLELSATHNQLSAAEEELRTQYEELQMSEEFLRKSEEKYKLALEGANDVIWEWDNETKSFYVSNKWQDIIGDLPIKKMSINNVLKFIHKDDVDIVTQSIKDHLEDMTDFCISEFRIHTGGGNYKWLLTRGKALRDQEGKVIKVAGSMTDISERKEIEAKIKYMAYYDTLTKLPNRILFMEKLAEELEKAKEGGYTGAIMLIDLDNFKNINDTLGHEYGDKLIRFIAEKLQDIMIESQTVYRFGGDEFLILKSHLADGHEIKDLAKRILDIFEKPFIMEDRTTFITASIGIATYPNDGETTTAILKNADVAMYMAKASGKNRFLFFNQEMYEGLERKIKIEAILRQALIDESFEIYYQPQIDMKYNKISGFEALLRLNTKEIGFISPAEFIPIAEESGLIKEIGTWCLKKACQKNKEWRDKGYQFGTIAVNISNVQFEQNNFIEVVTEILEETQLKPEFLEIEITESILMKSLERNIDILEKLKVLGVKIALDDFGTGYSSFNYLRRLPINTLKIDKSFIDDICRSEKEQAIAYGIIQMAHQMTLDVVAEGVEDAQQLEVLQRKECDKVQGYFFSRPLPAKDAEALIEKYNQ